MTRRLSDRLGTISRSLSARARRADPLTAGEMERIAMAMAGAARHAAQLERQIIGAAAVRAVAAALDPSPAGTGGGVVVAMPARIGCGRDRSPHDGGDAA